MPHVTAVPGVGPNTSSMEGSNSPVSSSQPLQTRHRHRDRGQDRKGVSTVPAASSPAHRAAAEAIDTGSRPPIPRVKPSGFPSTLAPRETEGHPRRSGQGAAGDRKEPERRDRERSDQEAASLTGEERAGTTVEAGCDNEAIVGAHLLVFPLKQLDTLINLALSGSKKVGNVATNPATAHFLRHHITQTFEDFTELQGELNTLNYSLRSPHTEEEWLSVAWNLHDMVERGKDMPSQVMKIAANVVNLDHERQWRSWWYWVEVKRQERRKEREKDAGEAKDGKGREIIQTQVVDTELSLDMMGTKLLGIKKFRREMSDEEKLATERMFYEAVLGELRKLPNWGGDGCFGAGERKDGRVAMMEAIEKEEKMSIAEDVSIEGAAKRSDSEKEGQIVAKESARDGNVKKKGSRGVNKANGTPANRAGREGSGRRRPLADRSLSGAHRTTSSSILSSASSQRGTQAGRDARDPARRGS